MADFFPNIFVQDGSLVFVPSIDDAAANYYETNLEVSYASPLGSDSESLMIDTLLLTFTIELSAEA